MRVKSLLQFAVNFTITKKSYASDILLQFLKKLENLKFLYTFYIYIYIYIYIYAKFVINIYTRFENLLHTVISFK